MFVPLLDLNYPYQEIKNEIEETIKRICESQKFILGSEVEDFENEIIKLTGTTYALGVSSGTDALLMSLMALGVGLGDEVITSPFTFFATAGSISRLKARPVFVDIDPITFNIDADLIKEKITSKTKAIIPVHLFGQSADMTKIMQVAKDNQIPVIEDAAQAIYAKYKDMLVGSIGEIGCYSFFPSKNIGAFGDAGLVSTSSEKLYNKLKVLRMHGQTDIYRHEYIGGNFRIDALQAAILKIKLKQVNWLTDERRKNAKNYYELFEQKNLLGTVILPMELKENFHVFNQFVIRTPLRDKLREFLTSSNIGTQVYYPLPLHLQACFSDLCYNREDLPESEKASKEVLALPIFPGLKYEQQEYVVSKISDFYN